MTGVISIREAMAAADYVPAVLPIEVPGVDRSDLADLFRELGFRVGAEVGVEKGLHAAELCQRIPGLKLYAVDAWKAYRGYREHVTQSKVDGLMESARERLAEFDVEYVRAFSVDAAKQFEDGSLDFVYIDANHGYKYVLGDLEAWTPKVRSGGIVSGHDYCNGTQRSGYTVEVIPAVQDFTTVQGIKPWFVLGTPQQVRGSSRERPRSFFWVRA